MAVSDEVETTDNLQHCVSEPEATVTPDCTAQCCIVCDKAFQPTDKKTVETFTTKKRNFQPQWYKQFPWVSVCTTYKKAYCLLSVELKDRF